jgi:hypothetical protein
MSVVEVSHAKKREWSTAVDPVRRACHDLVGASPGAQSAEFVTEGLDVVDSGRTAVRGAARMVEHARGHKAPV